MAGMMSRLIPFVILLLTLVLTACQTPQRGSEEYWFNKMRDEQRAQCRLLPSPLSESCLKDVAGKKYEDFQRQRATNQNEST